MDSFGFGIEAACKIVGKAVKAMPKTKNKGDEHLQPPHDGPNSAARRRLRRNPLEKEASPGRCLAHAHDVADPRELLGDVDDDLVVNTYT